MNSDKKMIDCGEALTIANAAEIHQSLQAALSESLHLELKADEVDKVDSAGLQVILALFKEIEKVSGKVEWNTPSDVLKQAAITLGISDRIGLNF